MNFSEQIKDFTGLQASKMIVELLSRVSDERLVQLTHLGEKLTSDYEILGAIRGVRNMLQTPDHPAKKMFRDVPDYLPPKNRTIIFNTLEPSQEAGHPVQEDQTHVYPRLLE